MLSDPDKLLLLKREMSKREGSGCEGEMEEAREAAESCYACKDSPLSIVSDSESLPDEHPNSHKPQLPFQENKDGLTLNCMLNVFHYLNIDCITVMQFISFI